MPSASAMAGGSAERGARGGGGGHGAEHGRRVKARLVDAHGCHQAQAADRLDPRRDALERGAAIGALLLGDRQHRRHDHRARVHRPPFEGVIEILAVGGGAIDERGPDGVDGAGMPDRRCGTCREARSQDRADIVALPRGNAEPDHIEDERLRHRPHSRRQRPRIERRDALGQHLGDGRHSHDISLGNLRRRP